ncbi:MAG: DUF3368 domain-containing protein [Leptolyngbyaceae cyanobacterium MO_188.B28]|nr:DUF3368 domain-containing protein [Leptolyngbyaceae cyanobacterium MO_188.B28]
MIVVNDTAALSSLAIAGQLSLLKQLYNTVIIPQAVADELAKASSDDSGIGAIPTLSWIEIRQASNSSMVNTLQEQQDLDTGDAEAIILALELGAERILMDERLSRQAAIKIGLPITGILGILVAAKIEGLISAVKPVMDDLISQAGFWVSGQLYDEVLQAVGE